MLDPNSMARNDRWAATATIAALTLLCLLLPTQNSTLDAWYYAACVRYGHELLLPHHLLYNAAGWLWVEALKAIGILADTLTALKALNTLAAGACLLLLRQLFRLLLPQKPVWPWLLVAGASFGMLRFATENEAYLPPVALSLLASSSWALFQGQPQRLWYVFGAGFWAALACLFHQIHFFWWLGLLLGTGWYASAKLRSLVLFALPALLVPGAYAAALGYWHLPLSLESLWRFVFHDYYAGTAANGISGHGLLLSVVNLGRTFVQVHGSTLALLRLYPGLLLAVALVIGLLGYAATALWRAWKNRTAAASGQQPSPVRAAFLRTHLLILGLHFLFAVSAAGNAEFMAMLPVLLALVLGVAEQWLPTRGVGAAGLALLAWNLAFGLVPANRLRFADNARLLTLIQQEPHSWFLLDNHNLVLNQLYYETGQAQPPGNVLPAPTLLVKRAGQSPARLRGWLHTQLQAGHRVFTTGLGGPQLLDRAQVVYGNQNAELLRGFRTEKVDSFPTAFGPLYLTEIR
ncbi:hypothetical protein [Hymenobacter metallicola]|uniref:Glycosyltransferase RgtA/B/C/D-like domain-containing protein n=1 Tax=Hymenobacter metallicola TaxID=2563114 RepID=A0A4Z0PUH4_9BACT|nr:hypothetical protein [Hymenobacter metallicola]TGE21145.1 hypothetical protein E5K02_24345 [Hymenobacter metallicola]